MRVIVTGDRHWAALDLAEDILKRLLAKYGPNLTIVHGGATGVDNAFAEACRKLGVADEPHVANWKGMGKLAGPVRNREMILAGASLCIALHGSLAASKGTKDCVRQAIHAGIPTYLIDSDGGRLGE